MAILRDRLGFSDLRVTLQDPPGTESRLFASTSVDGDDSVRSGCPLGLRYRLEILGISGADRMLSLLGASLAVRMDASRPSCFSRSLPAERGSSELAEAAATRFLDSQANFATLCFLDPEPFLDRALSAFPSVDPECLREDVIRCLAAFFEASGGIFLCDSGQLLSLSCGSRPADTELLQAQVGKYLRRFVSAEVRASVAIHSSRTFESPRAGEMKEFLAGCAAGSAPRRP